MPDWSDGLADQAGLGAFRHEHRSRNGVDEPVPLIGFVLCTAPAFAQGGNENWVVAALAAVAAVGLVTAYVFAADGHRWGVRRESEPVRIAIYDGEMVVELLARKPLTIPWTSVTEVDVVKVAPAIGRVPSQHLGIVHTAADGRSDLILIGPMTARSRLVREIKRHG